ncbi:polyphosphate polymerase domain-containing protein [Brevibacillus choshinensis]|uniref:polyphosphate polymerase domain-containing protein n=1 Tax=Brevibacillus choshinensis TaxID=54911 RepID=UPI002E1ABE43|nr:polyphosphate polymerase domain-containing protein [Brevibacillus choshinensis]MED4752932.1 polyphosphate polymerase domain-containing protein [Brevibacillus choshinensis]MED4781492.1 polyphosphate polymerase domain-containing protein [Brevibacillus choshinensis]
MQFGNKRLRNEWKYYIRFHDYISLRNKLRLITTLDPNSTDDEGYHIRSLYFDDVYDTSLYEKNYGVYKRRKYRIRIYNQSDAVIKLERKSKYDGYICKEAVSITRDEYEQVMAGQLDFLLKRKTGLLHDFYYDCKNHLFQPRVVTDYVREAYLMEIGNVRVTFDKSLMTNVNTFDIFDPQMKTVHAIHEPKMIMEVKFDNFLPINIRYLLQYFSNQRSAISKYVVCREESKVYYKL